MSSASCAVYLLPGIKVCADCTEVAKVRPVPGTPPLLFQNPTPAGRAMLQCRICWEDVGRAQAKASRQMISKELVQLQVLGTEGEGLQLLFINLLLEFVDS